jgi:arylsulfatase A-like enzyme
MNRTTKITIVIFSILSLITIVSNLLKYKGSNNLYIILIVLFFNLCLGLLTIVILNKIIKVSKKGKSLFIFYLVLSFFFYWYIISTLLHHYYGTFLSLGGFYYYISTRTYLSLIIFYLCSGFLILSTTFLFYYLSRKYVFEKNPPEKIINKKVKIIFYLTPLVILILILILIPFGQAYDSSPIIEMITQFIWASPPEEIISNISQQQEKILDFSLDKPNFIIIMLESIPAEHLKIYGYERDLTPNIDYLAKRGIVFNNAYSTASHSDYAQTSFLSSRYAFTNNYRNFFDKDYPREFIWDILKDYDYNQAYISSQNDHWANMINYYNTTNLDLYSYSLTDENWDYGSGNARKDYDEKTINKSIDWISKNENPFFLYINLQATHHPYSYPENNSLFKPDNVSSSTTYFNIDESDYNASINAYDNSIVYVDKQIGVLLEYLRDDRKILGKTVVVITSDHGQIFERRHGNIRHGFGVYNEEVRIPLIFYIPHKPPRTINEKVRHLDVIPTMLDIANFPQSKEFQGKPMIENQDIFLTAQNQNFKLGLVKDDIKYMIDGFNYIPEVYNLTQDPYEQNNLIKNKKDELYYYIKYGNVLYSWVNCQLNYYEKEKWKNGERIECG